MTGSDTMAPEEAALVRQELSARFDKTILREITQYATTHAARLVAASIYPARVAASIATIQLHLEPGERQVRRYFQMLIVRAAEQIARDMDDAAEEIAYQISYLLDSRVSSASVHQAAIKFSGPLLPAQTRQIVHYEQAWWLRLHAAIESADAG